MPVDPSCFAGLPMDQRLNNLFEVLGAATFGNRLPAPTNLVAVYDDETDLLDINWDAIPSDTVLEFAAADLHYNGRNGVESPRHNAFAVLKLSTDAESLTVTAISDVFDFGPTYANIGVRVGGVFQAPLVLTASGTPTEFNVPLGTAGTLRAVELIAGLQSNPAGTTLGTYITDVVANGGGSHSIVAPSTANRVVIYGDSISVGGNATNPESQAWTVLLRYTHGHEVMVEGWGNRALGYDVAVAGTLDTTKAQAFAARLASYAPETLWVAIGTNDYGLNYWFNATDFQNAYADFLDRFHTLLPATVIYCQTPLVRSSEGANGFGNTLAEFRTAISNACASRPWATLVDGTAILTTGDLVDGLHPGTSGHATYAAFVEATL